MARKQYKIYTPGNWTSNFGFSFVAIANVSGSGKKITVRHLEAQVLSHLTAGVNNSFCSIYRCTAPVIDGEDMVLTLNRMDDAVALPDVTVRRHSSVSVSGNTDRVGRVDIAKRGISATTVNDHKSQHMHFGLKRLSGITRSAIKQTDVEPLTLNQNEALALYIEDSIVVRGYPVRVLIEVSIDGKTATWNFVALALPGIALASIENLDATAVVKVLRISLTEIGTTDTPTIRVVPIGQNRPGDITDTSRQNMVAMPMDTNDGPLSSSVCLMYSDIDFQPKDVPEVYMSPASGGSPKDMNYLHTKDFNGPMWRNFFPELINVRTNGIPDSLNVYNSSKWSDLLMRRKSACPATSIILNPGEGMALVSSAETAVGVQAAWSGWPLLYFSAVIDVEPQYSPTLTLTGLQNPSEVRIFDAGTTTQLAGEEDITDGTFSWNYDVDAVTAVDIAILSLGYQNTRLLNYTLSTSSDVSLPIQQVIDRQYSN